MAQLQQRVSVLYGETQSQGILRFTAVKLSNLFSLRCFGPWMNRRMMVHFFFIYLDDSWCVSLVWWRWFFYCFLVLIYAIIHYPSFAYNFSPQMILLLRQFFILSICTVISHRHSLYSFLLSEQRILEVFLNHNKYREQSIAINPPWVSLYHSCTNFTWLKWFFPQIEHRELVAKSLILYHICIDIQNIHPGLWGRIMKAYSSPLLPPSWMNNLAPQALLLNPEITLMYWQQWQYWQLVASLNYAN